MLNTYFVYDNWGGGFHDTRKSGDDSNLCWAAAAANILAWSNWNQTIPLEPGPSAQAIFEQYKMEPDVGNVAGVPRTMWGWWSGKKGYSKLDLKQYYYHMGFAHRPNVLSIIDECFRQRKSGVALQMIREASEIGEKGNSHFVTCWGFEYEDSLGKESSEAFLQIYITDSDDSPSTPHLKAYQIEKGGGPNLNYWYLKAFLGKDDYFIADLYALAKRPEL